MQDEILTLPEVAQLPKVAEKTVYLMAQKGQLPAFKVVEDRDIAAYGKLKRPAEGRAVPLPSGGISHPTAACACAQGAQR